MRTKTIALIVTFILFIIGTSSAQETLTLTDSPHPRLWLRPSELDGLRANANDDNPLWVQINVMAEEARTLMDDGTLIAGDLGGRSYEDYPLENYAMLFAFMAQIHPAEASRADYASRARTLLMTILNEAAKGVQEDAPWRSTEYSIGDRSRWYGAAYGLVVDWIYDTLTAEDKATINTVFTRWCDENRNAYTTTSNHPEPIGVVNDPILTQDRNYARWSNNNYYAAHMRNMGMMAMSLNASDDPTGALSPCLNEAVGAWLYVLDDQTRTDSLGGMGAEGFEYSPQTFGYMAQFLLALYTAGYGDAARFGQQVSFDTNPFWDDSIRAYVNALSPVPYTSDEFGEVYTLSWYGSGQQFLMPDFIQMFGSLGYYAALTDNTAQAMATAYLQLNTAPNLADGLSGRVDFEQFAHPVLYYLLMQGNYTTPTMPETYATLSHFAEGLSRYSERTSADADATWFNYSLSWNLVDHQSANGNTIEFYRKGEWLTAIRPGYDLDYITSDNLNTLLIENTVQEYDDWRQMSQQKGSQWLYINAGDPPKPIITQGADFVSIYGDATNLYNSPYVNSVDVQLATRYIVWLKPDILVIVDTAKTGQEGFKRFVLNLPQNAVVEGSITTMTTPNGQQFEIHDLSSNTTRQVIELGNEVSDEPANGNLMLYRYVSEAVGDPTEAVFVHVLVGKDGGTVTPTMEVVSSDTASTVVNIGERTITVAGETITVSP